MRTSLDPRRRPELNRGDGFCRPAPNHSATSPCRPARAGHLCAAVKQVEAGTTGPVAGPGAEDGARTRDLNLGKVALYQLSYFRLSPR
jgi:hypothetical protein